MIKENYEKYEPNYGDNIEEVSIIGYGLGDDRKKKFDEYLEPEYNGLSLASLAKSRFIDKDAIYGMHPDRLNPEVFDSRSDFRRTKHILRHNKRQFNKALKYAWDAKKSASDKQLFHNLGKFMTGIVSLPAVGYTLETAMPILNNPVVQGIGAIDGIYNLFTDQGVSKTIDHFKNDEYGKGVLSLAGDVLDASPLLGIPRVIKTTKAGIEDGLNAIDLIRLNHPIKKSTKFAADLFASDLIKPKTIPIYHYGNDFRNSAGQFTLPRMYSGGDVGLHVSNTPLHMLYQQNPKKILHAGLLTIYPDRIADVSDMSHWTKYGMKYNPTIPFKIRENIDKIKDWTPEEYYNIYGGHYRMPDVDFDSNDVHMNYFNNNLLNNSILNAGYDVLSYDNEWEIGSKLFDVNGNEIPLKSYAVFNPNSVVFSKVIPYEPSTSISDYGSNLLKYVQEKYKFDGK